MQSGDTVVVTNLNGETAEGEIVEILATRADEYPADWLDVDVDATLWDYWQRTTDPAAPVVSVDLGGQVYEYPADKVEVLE